jgi:cyclohexa-1,5-dienecarbonyl-CoA hydratase
VTAATGGYKMLRVEELEGGKLWRLVLDAGKGNVIGVEALTELRAVWAELRVSPHVRAVVLDHEGKHFSFGASVEDHVKEKAPEMLALLHGFAKEVVGLGVPILVAVRGMCLGGGLELALLGQRIFATEDAKFGQPEITLGVFAPLGSLLLPSMVGNQLAADLLLSGRLIGAAEAQDAGLVAEITTGLGDSADPGAAALAWAREHLVEKSAAAIRFATRALWEGRDHAFARRLDGFERMYLDELMETHDANEGIGAFIDGRRTPEWKDA